MIVSLPRSADLFAHFRELVEAGAEDGPVEVWHDGKHCLNVRSLYRAALLTTEEEPTLRITKWHPHFKATVGPRVQALLDARPRRKAA